MTKKTLSSRVGIIALLGALPTACTDDIANPFNNDTEASGSGSGSTAAMDATAAAESPDDDGGTTAGAATSGTDTMAVDDTAGTTAAETSADASTTGEPTSDTGTAGTDGGTTAGVEETGSTSGGMSNNVPCPGADIPTDMGLPVTVTASSSMQDGEFTGTCGGGGAPDYAWTFTAPMDGDFLFDTFQSTFDTVLYVLDGECTGEELVCDDDGLSSTNQSLASVSLVADQTVTVVVDAFGLTGGNISLTVREGSVECPVEELDSVPVTVTGQTAVATDEFAGTCGAGTAPDQGYLFTAPQDGTYTFEITNNDFDTVMFLLDGTCGGTELACNDNLIGTVSGASGLTFPMAMGESVTVVVDGYFDTFGNFDLSIGVLEGECPDSDLGNMAAPFTVAGSTTVEDNGSAGSCGGLASPDYSWTWTAPTAATYRFSTENSDFDTVIYVRDGADCLGAELGCSNDTGLGTDGSTFATMAAGQTVTIIVDGNGGTGNFDLSVDVDCPAQDLGSVVPQTITDTTLAASDQFVTSCDLGASPDQAYTFTAATDGTYVFETSNNDFDTLLFVLDDVCGGNELGCNDNVVGAVDGHSGLILGLTAGQTITVGVQGIFGAAGTFDLTVSQLEGDCPDADLGDTGVPFTTSGDTSPEDNGVGGTCGGLASNDYSYTWIAPSTGTFSFSTAGSAYNTVVYVNDGTCGGAELGCNDDIGGTLQSSAVAALTMGQQVVITVDGSGAAGAYDLTIDAASDCCFVHNYAGCDDSTVEDCVCLTVGDSYCCTNQWDSICLNEAINQCLADCA